MRKSRLLSYDDIYLRPCLSNLSHRAKASTSVNFLGRSFNLPVVPANMEDVISFDNAKWLSTNGYFYIMHRFKGVTEKFIEFALNQNLPYISISVGASLEAQEEFDRLVTRFGTSNFHYITIDVAHGHHQNVKDMVVFFKQWFANSRNKPKIIAGNVATVEAYRFLCELGVDAVKVGIGGGSICTTKYETGFHLPTATSLMEICSKIDDNYFSYRFKDVPIIADGGIKHHGDIAKALVLGAKLVMCGNLFASCIDSPAEIIHGKKIYRGSTSYASKGNDNHIEGRTIELEGEITYAKRMEKIQQALRSSISYAGGDNLDAFRDVEWDICS